MNVACEDQQFDPSSSNTVVVEGFLYAHQPVQSIRISELIPFIAEEEKNYGIADAQVVIHWGEEKFLLTPSEDSIGLYYYDGSGLSIIEGETYQLSLEYFGKTTFATTTVPGKPQQLKISEDTLEIEPIESFEDLRDRGIQDNIEVTWSNENGEYFYIIVENVEEDPEEINTLEFNGFGRPNFNLITQPTTLDVHNIQPFSLTQYGRYRVVVFHVAQEYADLYETSEQDSRNLTEPLNNIENGLGIFTSFSSDTVSFVIIKPGE
ncbi:MAG: DUF4249 family protein [Cyclobacteriaceae bacterium]|nr:DUF4249 family protein [Cyclobacteriaceae bacterium SS2]